MPSFVTSFPGGPTAITPTPEIVSVAPVAAPRVAVDPFPGSYVFNSNVTVAITSPISTTESRSRHETGEITTIALNTERMVVTEANGEQCGLTAQRSGAAGLQFAPGQTCEVTDTVRNMRMSLTLRSGSGSIHGEVIELSFEWGVEASAFLPVSGLAAQRTTGSRLTADPAAVAAAPATAPVESVPPPQPAPQGPYANAAPQAVQAQPQTGSPYMNFGPNAPPAYGGPSGYVQPGAYAYPTPQPYGARAPVYAPQNPQYAPQSYPTQGYPTQSYPAAQAPAPQSPTMQLVPGMPYGYVAPGQTPFH